MQSYRLKGPPIIMRRGRTIRHPLYYETKGSLDDGYAEMRVIYMLLRAYIMRRAGIIMRRGLDATCSLLTYLSLFFFNYETPARDGRGLSSPLVTIIRLFFAKRTQTNQVC